MTSRKLTLLVVLMSFAVVCLAGFQCYWLYGSYTQFEQQFDRDVKQSLTETVERMLDLRLNKSNGRVKLSNLLSDTLIVENFVSDTAIDHSKGQLQIRIETDGVIAGKAGDPNLDLEEILEDSASMQIFTFASFSDDVQHLDSQGVQHMLDSLQNLSRAIPHATDHFIKDVLFWPRSERTTRDFLVLDSILKMELAKFNIALAYQFGVYAPDPEIFLFKNDSTIADATLLGEGSYEALLLSFGEKKLSRIRLIFPGKSGFLRSKMSLVLAGSILLMLLVAGCYAYTLRIILRQKKLSEIKNDFINNVTHELKAPIANTSLAIEALLNFNVRKEEERTEQYLNIAKKENSRLSGMVEKVLNVAIQEREGIQLKNEPVEMHAVLQDAVESITLQVEQRGGSVNMNLDATQTVVQGDPEHLSGVVYNLLDNANKYSANAPQIEVKTKTESGQLKISISDHGIGIGAPHLKRIFEKFYRIPTGNVHNVKGFGLGLNYVQAIVERHAGRVLVESEPRKGSTFEIYLTHA